MGADPGDHIEEYQASGRGGELQTFNGSVSSKFVTKNRLQYIVRGHQLVMEGYKWSHDNRVLTVFSAPNYTYSCGNRGAILSIGADGSPKIYQFDAVPDQHGPPVIPRTKNTTMGHYFDDE
eukprot:NODE_704_length_805_cov_661.205026_g534_i0.p2 GENE.NODE_704_length_805_cov_661.205026_g534_i0~~NODE_704_length_805_cov_661.205026_g534_i0.p2  ORF type:complete len:130 (+),score=24.12 NODE_704_length_805_cov_661.205026_g534_i0:29-391(+)